MEPSKVLILHRKVNSGGGARPTSILLIFSICLFSAVACGKTYRWVDASGETVYSQIPPPPGVATVEIGAPPPPAETPAQAQQRLNRRLQQLEDNREDRELADEKAAEAQAEASRRADLCEKARSNLTSLEQSRGNSRYVDQNGEYHRLTEETLTSKKVEAQKVIDENCAE